MTDPLDEDFARPGPLDAVKWGDYDGRLIMITPHAVQTVPHIDKEKGTRDVIFADVVILDGPGSPKLYPNGPVYPAFLQGQARPYLGTGRRVVGRLGQDTRRQQRGQNAPWVLGDPTPADIEVARQYLRTASRGAVAGHTAPGGHTGTSVPTDAPPF